MCQSIDSKPHTPTRDDIFSLSTFMLQPRQTHNANIYIQNHVTANLPRGIKHHLGINPCIKLSNVTTSNQHLQLTQCMNVLFKRQVSPHHTGFNRSSLFPGRLRGGRHVSCLPCHGMHCPSASNTKHGCACSQQPAQISPRHKKPCRFGWLPHQSNIFLDRRIGGS